VIQNMALGINGNLGIRVRPSSNGNSVPVTKRYKPVIHAWSEKSCEMNLWSPSAVKILRYHKSAFLGETKPIN